MFNQNKKIVSMQGYLDELDKINYKLKVKLKKREDLINMIKKIAPEVVEKAKEMLKK